MKEKKENQEIAYVLQYGSYNNSKLFVIATMPTIPNTAGERKTRFCIKQINA